MIVDSTGISLIPGNKGLDCPGNGTHVNNQGEIIECCCDECDYLICCTEFHGKPICEQCTDKKCPRNLK